MGVATYLGVYVSTLGLMYGLVEAGILMPTAVHDAVIAWGWDDYVDVSHLNKRVRSYILCVCGVLCADC